MQQEIGPPAPYFKDEFSRKAFDELCRRGCDREFLSNLGTFLFAKNTIIAPERRTPYTIYANAAGDPLVSDSGARFARRKLKSISGRIQKLVEDLEELKTTRFLREEYATSSIRMTVMLSQLRSLSDALARGPDDVRTDWVTERRLAAVLDHVTQKLGAPNYELVSQWLCSIEHCGSATELAKWYQRYRTANPA